MSGSQEMQIDVGSQPRFSIVSGRLNINQPEPSDAAIYRCYATNLFGTIVSRESRLRRGS